MVIRALLLKVLALTLMMKKILEERLRLIGLLDQVEGFVQYWKDRLWPNHSSTRQTGKYKTRVYEYAGAGMTSDFTVGGLCEIFMRD